MRAAHWVAWGERAPGAAAPVVEAARRPPPRASVAARITAGRQCRRQRRLLTRSPAFAPRAALRSGAVYTVREKEVAYVLPGGAYSASDLAAVAAAVASQADASLVALAWEVSDPGALYTVPGACRRQHPKMQWTQASACVHAWAARRSPVAPHVCALTPRPRPNTVRCRDGRAAVQQRGGRGRVRRRPLPAPRRPPLLQAGGPRAAHVRRALGARGGAGAGAGGRRGARR